MLTGVSHHTQWPFCSDGSNKKKVWCRLELPSVTEKTEEVLSNAGGGQLSEDRPSFEEGGPRRLTLPHKAPLDKITLLHESLDYFVDKESSSGAKKWDVEGRLSVVTSVREEIMGNSSLSLLLHILLLNKLAFAIHRELGI